MRFLLLNAVRDRSLESVRRKNPGKVQRRPLIGGKPLPPGARRVFLFSEFTPEIIGDIWTHQDYGNVKLIEVGKRGPVDMQALSDRLGFTHPAADEPEPMIAEEGDVGELDDGSEVEIPAGTEIAESDDAPPAPEPDDSEKVVKASVGVMQVEVTAGEDGILGTDDDEVKVSSAKAEPEPEEESELVLPEDPEPMDLDEVLEPEPEAAPEEPAEDEFVVPDDFSDYLSGLKNRELAPVLTMLGGSAGGKKKSDLVTDIMSALGAADVDPTTARNAIEKAQSFGEQE